MSLVNWSEGFVSALVLPSVTWLTTWVGVHRNSISDWERSSYVPNTPEMVHDLAEALALSPMERDQLLRAAQYPTDSHAQIGWVLPLQTALQPPQRDWGEAPAVDLFYGRAHERETLTRWLTTDRCRLVSIMGMGGIGKTTLATKIAAEIADDYPFLLWCSLRNAPPVDEILAESIRFFSNQQVAELPPDTGRRITLLLDLLRRQRCLLILDNVEAILRGGEGAGHYRAGHEGYGELFRRAGETEHRSCLLLTSREKPRDVAILEGTGRPIKSLDLATLDLAAGRAILERGGLVGTDKNWATLVERYSGNPLALKLIAETVRELFGSDIAAFLQEGVFIFGGVAQLLDEQFERLSASDIFGPWRLGQIDDLQPRWPNSGHRKHRPDGAPMGHDQSERFGCRVQSKNLVTRENELRSHAIVVVDDPSQHGPLLHQAFAFFWQSDDWGLLANSLMRLPLIAGLDVFGQR
jgi:hypothetical protein